MKREIEDEKNVDLITENKRKNEAIEQQEIDKNKERERNAKCWHKIVSPVAKWHWHWHWHTSDGNSIPLIHHKWKCPIATLHYQLISMNLLFVVCCFFIQLKIDSNIFIRNKMKWNDICIHCTHMSLSHQSIRLSPHRACGDEEMAIVYLRILAYMYERIKLFCSTIECNLLPENRIYSLSLSPRTLVEFISIDVNPVYICMHFNK